MKECHCRQAILLSALVAILIVTYVAAYHKPHSEKKHVDDAANRRGDSSDYSTLKTDTEFVVSHYDENLDWLRPLANLSHVYHKGKLTAPPFPVKNWERLPNVGREGHTYLYHIIHRYDSLADLTVFLQGHGSAPSSPRWCFPTPMSFVREATKGRYCKVIGQLNDWGSVPLDLKWKVALDTGKMQRGRVRTVGEFYTAVFGNPHPASVPLCYTACFSATRGNLRRYLRSLYQRAISYLEDHPDPEEGHMMERLWATIIDTR